MRLVVFIGLACFYLAFAAAAESTVPTTRVLSMRECVELALQHNLDVQIERYSPEIARYNLNGSYGAYEPSFNFSAQRDFLSQPSTFDPKKSGIDSPYDLRTDSFGAGFLGRLPTGLTYGLSGNSDFLDARTDFNSSPGTAAQFPPDGIRHTNQFFVATGITLRQPLLKDFWIDVYRQKIRVNKKNVKISELTLRWQIMNTVTAVQLGYYDLVFAREKVRVEEKALELARQFLKETRRRVEVGDLPPLDEKQAESQVETTQTDLFAAQQVLAEQQNTLKSLLTDDLQAWKDVDPEPSENLLAVSVPFDRNESWRSAITNRPDLMQFRLELEKQDIIVRYNFNQLFPSLDVVGSYGGRAAESTFETAVGDIGDRNNPAYSYGVVMTIPLGNRSARNNYKASKAVKEQAQLQLKKLEQTVLLQVDNSLKSAQSTFKRVDSTRQGRLYAEAALDAEQKKLQNGASTGFIVLQLQQKLTDARTAEVRALADYNKALSQLALWEGNTLEKNQLSVEVK